MAIFKCKMCGGTLEINNNESVLECEYCGTTQTLPKLDDDRKSNMYDRANHFRRNNEFDKAMGIYEQILNEDNTDAEAYWSLVLCRYGIEYNKNREYITWEKCSLRRWLNTDFIAKAFTIDEKNYICNTTVKADENPNYDTNPGNDTQDKIFLLSIDEIDKYLTKESYRQ